MLSENLRDGIQIVFYYVHNSNNISIIKTFEEQIGIEHKSHCDEIFITILKKKLNNCLRW